MTPDSRKGRPDSGPTTITECSEGTADGPRVATVAALVDLRGYRSRRWARRHLDVLGDDQAVTTTAECARLHAGACDYWGRCSNMSSGMRGREVLGAMHPWRVSA